jgi:hypothetical protein
MSKLLKSTEAKIFLTVWVVYIFFISNYGGNFMEDSSLRLTLSVVDKGSVIIDDYVFKGIEDNAFYNGHYYSGFSPGSSFLAVPAYLVFKPIFYLLPESFHGFQNMQLELILLNIVATVFVASLLSALCAVLIYKILSQFSDNKFHKLALTFLFSFGTLFFIYSTSYSRDVLKTIFLFASFYILFGLNYGLFNRRRPLLFFLSGLFLAFCVAADYKMIIVVPLFVIYMLFFSKKKDFFYFGVGLFIPLLFSLFYNYVAFGSPLSTSYSYRSPNIMQYYSRGFFGMTYPTLERIYGLTFSPFRGFFFYMPVMLLSSLGIGIKLFSRDKKYKVDMLFILILFLILFWYNASLASGWDAGGSFGPRYLIPAIPFMVIPLIFVFGRIKAWTVALFSAASFFVNFLGVLYGREALWTVTQENKYVIFNTYIPLLFSRGLTTYTFNLIKLKIYDIPVFAINLVVLFFLLLLFLFIWFVWKE